MICLGGSGHEDAAAAEDAADGAIHCYTLEMFDSFGDSWNDAYFWVDGQSFTVEEGSYAAAEVCLEDGCYDISAGGGSYDGEISWSFAGYEGEATYNSSVCVYGGYDPNSDADAEATTISVEWNDDSSDSDSSDHHHHDSVDFSDVENVYHMVKELEE